MWFYCGHFQFHDHFGPLDWSSNCIIRFVIVKRKNCRFDFGNQIEVQKLLEFKVEILSLFDSSHWSSQLGMESTLSACSPISL